MPNAPADVITVDTSDDNRQLFPEEPSKTLSNPHIGPIRLTKKSKASGPANKRAKIKAAGAPERAAKAAARDNLYDESVFYTSEDGSEWNGLANQSKRRKVTATKRGATSTARGAHSRQLSRNASVESPSVSAHMPSEALSFSPDFVNWAKELAKGVTQAVTDELRTAIRLMRTEFGNATESKLVDVEKRLDAMSEELREERSRNRILAKEIEELKASRDIVRGNVREPDTGETLVQEVIVWRL